MSKINKNSDLPSFFHHTEKELNKDKGQETLQDFFLGWTIHCASDRFKESNPQIQELARRVLFTIIYGFNDNEKGSFVLSREISESFKVTSVKSHREYKYVDLLFFIDAEEAGVHKKYVIAIEDKYYTRISNGQLARCRQIVEEEFSQPESELIFAVVFCDDEIIRKEPVELDKCRKDGFKLLSICDIQQLAGFNDEGCELTGNHLFDEFWFPFNVDRDR